MIFHTFSHLYLLFKANSSFLEPKYIIKFSQYLRKIELSLLKLKQLLTKSLSTNLTVWFALICNKHKNLDNYIQKKVSGRLAE